MKSLKLNAFLNGLRSLLSVIFPLITFPYVSRVLSVNGIGKYNFSNSIISYFMLIAALGISNYAVREGAKYRNNKRKINQFANEVFTINACSAIVSYVCLFICLITFSKLHSYLICILIYSIQIGFSVISVDWLFTIYEDFVYITIRSILFQIISILLLFVFVRHSNDYLNYAAITVFSAVGSNVLNFYRAEKEHRIHLVFHFNWKKHMTPILILFAANVANLIYVNSDVTLLGLLKSNYVVGIYSVSSRIYTIIKSVLSAVLLVSVPRLALLYGNKEFSKYKILLSKLTNMLVLLVLPAMIGLIMLSKQVVLIIAGNHFLRSVMSLRILAVAYIFSILAWILSDCVLIPAKREKYLLYSMTISAVINIVFNIIMIPYWSENAAAISTVLSELAMFTINYHYAKDIVKEVFVSKDLLRTFTNSFVGCIGIIIVCLGINIIFSSIIIKTILSVLFSVLVYGLILVMLKNTYASSLIKQGLDRMKGIF
ncbi:flippase [Limosilactobacillus mucosae]|uniref:flippase n=1 Tax=Limosilactobacillus mucosae TaxID=97478 RepID=UPI0029B7C47F|nr:flippase [Limosilactobacillus mucosae]MDX2312408.1 flippase [Limosilactobacillus mucosae]